MKWHERICWVVIIMLVSTICMQLLLIKDDPEVRADLITKIRLESLVAGEGTDWYSSIEVWEFLQASDVDVIGDDLGWSCRDYTRALIAEAEGIGKSLEPYYTWIDGEIPHVMALACLESGRNLIIEPQDDRMWLESPDGLEVQVVGGFIFLGTPRLSTDSNKSGLFPPRPRVRRYR